MYFGVRDVEILKKEVCFRFYEIFFYYFVKNREERRSYLGELNVWVY